MADELTVDQKVEVLVKNIGAVPGIFEGLKKEVEVVVSKIAKENAEVILSFKTEDELYRFLSKIADKFINTGLLEPIDDKIFYMLIKKFIDPIIDKIAGNDWHEKLNSWLNSLTPFGNV